MSLLDRLTGRRQAQADLREALDALNDARGQQIAQAQMIDHLTSEVRGLQEDTTSDLEDKLNSTGSWRLLGESPNAGDLRKARRAYLQVYKDKSKVTRRFPISRRIVDMHGDFAFSGGVEAPACDDEQIAKRLSDWWWYETNQEGAFSMRAQRMLSARLLVDGCCLLACISGSEGRPLLVRPMERLEFSDVVVHPEDREKVLYYERTVQKTQWDPKQGLRATGEEEKLYYPDFDNREDDPEFEDPYRDTIPIAEDKSGLPIHVLRLKIGGLGATDWGTSMMAALMPWELLAEDIATDQATISCATAALMNKLVVKGGSSAVDTVKAAWNQSGTDPAVNPPGVGDMNVMNEAVQLIVSRASTGASESVKNIRIMHQVMVACAGLALHYIGDPENANLATATAMELPVLRHLEAYQQVWANAYKRLARRELDEGGAWQPDLNVNIAMPEIIRVDLLDHVEAIQIAADQGWASEQQATREFWQAIGSDDVAAEIEEAKQAAEEAEEEAPEPVHVPTPPAVPEQQGVPVGAE